MDDMFGVGFAAAQPDAGSGGGARAQFEAWATGEGLNVNIYPHNGLYNHPVTRGAWMAWQHLAASQSAVEASRIPSDMVDGELSVASAIDQVVELFPSADRAALRILAKCLTHHSIHRYTAPPAAVSVDGWIDISERKPERPQEVLFVLDGRTVAGAWIGDIFCYNNKKRAALWWQPFPEPRIGAATHPQPAAAKQ